MSNPRRISRLLPPLLCVAAVCNPACLCEQDGDADSEQSRKVAQLDEFLTLNHEYGYFNGVALIAEEGQVIYATGFGAAVMEWSIPNDPDVVYGIASLSKQFTAALVLQLVSEGMLDLHGTIDRYLPGYPKETASRITVHQLLTHSSGLANYHDIEDFARVKSKIEWEPEEWVGQFEDLPLEFEPGEKFSYSNPGYFLLRMILEEVSGLSYERLARERIFDPLGMASSGFDDYYTITPRKGRGYDWIHGELQVSIYRDPSPGLGPGGLASTARDLFKWISALDSKKVLTPEHVAAMFSPQVEVDDRESYGYGWFITERKISDAGPPQKIAYHSGARPGVESLISRHLDSNKTIILINNTGYSRMPFVSRNIGRILYGLPFTEPRESLARALGRAARSGALEAEIDRYRSNPESFEVDDQEIDFVCLNLLNEGPSDGALRTCTLNAELHPVSASALYSLGRAYFETGDVERATANYLESLVLNPEEVRAREALDGLGVDYSRQLEESSKQTRAMMEKYVGRYRVRDQTYLDISIDQDELVIKATGREPTRLVRRSPGQFHVEAAPFVVLTFIVEADSSVDRLELKQGADMKILARVKEDD